MTRTSSSLFTDPEFLKLNPGAWNIGGTEYEIPDIVSGDSDMVWTTTSWIAADKAASGFLAGQFDPWGTHVNTFYLGLKYPVDGITPSDPYLPVSSQYVPLTPLSNVVLYQSLNQPPGNQDTRDQITQTFDALAPQVVGQRDLWAVVDQADAHRFLFPAAALQNAAGRFVLPRASRAASWSRARRSSCSRIRATRAPRTTCTAASADLLDHSERTRGAVRRRHGVWCNV